MCDFSNVYLSMHQYGQMKDYLMKGVPRHELEASIQQIFREADRDGSGTLDRAEFMRCLRDSGLGFTRQELNIILSEYQTEPRAGNLRDNLLNSLYRVVSSRHLGPHLG